MPRHGYCRICEYWRAHPYKVSERELFNKKVREGTSLRKLELLLEAYGLKAKKDLINKHIQECMGLEAKAQRNIEKSIQREGLKRVTRRVKSFFVRPKLEELPKECSHTVTTSFLSMHDGNIYTKCLECGKILGSFDPHKKKTKRKNDLLILESLGK